MSQRSNKQRNVEVISTLLSFGFGTLEIDDEGSTALQQIVRNRSSIPSDLRTFADAHIASGKPIDVFDKAHLTPLHVACLNTDFQARAFIANLCHVGASPFEKSVNGETPFSLAIEMRIWTAAQAFYLIPGRKISLQGFRYLIDQKKLLSHLLALYNDAVSWLYSLPATESLISSDRKFQKKPPILHVLKHGRVGFLIALLEEAPWPQDCIEAFQKEHQSDIASQPSGVQEKLKSKLNQMSEEDQQRCRARIEEGGGAQYLSD